MFVYFKIAPESIQKPFAKDIPLYMESFSENIEVNEEVSSSDEPEVAETENADITADMDVLDDSDNSASGEVVDSSPGEDSYADESTEG